MLATVLALLAPVHPGRAQTGGPGAAVVAQHGSLSGRVQNAGTGQYLNNARLSVQGTDLVAFTDESGTYRLAHVPAGPVVIEVFYTGMEPQQIRVNVPGGGMLERDIGLSGGARYRNDSEVVKLDSLVVSSSREMEGAAIAINEQRFAPNIVTIVSADEFGVVPDGNIGEFLKLLPGITMSYRGGDPREISMNGVPSDYVPITIGGFNLATSEGSGTGRNVELNAVSINNLSRIEAVYSPTPDRPAPRWRGRSIWCRAARSSGPSPFSTAASISRRGTAALSFAARAGRGDIPRARCGRASNSPGWCR